MFRLSMLRFSRPRYSQTLFSWRLKGGALGLALSSASILLSSLLLGCKSSDLEVWQVSDPPAFIQPKKQPKRDIWYDTEPIASQNPDAASQPKTPSPPPSEITDTFEGDDINNHEENDAAIEKVPLPASTPAQKPQISRKRIAPKARKKFSPASPPSQALGISGQTTFYEPLQKPTLPKSEYASSSGRATQKQAPTFGSAPQLQIKPSETALDAPPD
jgi:hypothetical protein